MRTRACRSRPIRNPVVVAIVASVAMATAGCRTVVIPSVAPTAASSTATTAATPIRFVALGDSYTIGTSVLAAQRWPEQLVPRVPRLELVANLGVNGFTSRDVIDVELPQLAPLQPQLVSLLIGVNDVVQGVPEATYRGNVQHILDELVRLVGANRILVVTTPDYTVTPAGADYGDPAQQSAGIRTNNTIITEVATARGIRVVDIYDISLRAGQDRSLVADDGLHPSGAQYALWVDRIAPIVEALLGEALLGP